MIIKKFGTGGKTRAMCPHCGTKVALYSVDIMRSQETSQWRCPLCDTDNILPQTAREDPMLSILCYLCVTSFMIGVAVGFVIAAVTQ